MNTFEILDEHDVPNDVESLIEEEFGGCKQPSEEKYVVKDPNYEVLNKVEIRIREDNLKLSMNEISVQRAKENDILDEVPEIFKSKNTILRKITGRTVQDRKEDMRQSVKN